MKYRISALILAIIIMIIYGTAIQPKLNLDNPWVNLISLVIVFAILAIIGTFARKMDKR
ncbi:hypothetical protein [Mammaliicoccus sciuri]|uniref:hypothetical protein n=1 Tax=Mammaliicoccus sciuri TaxID=1296 RepID=UPI001304E2E4|nr:hypothetical protein [Mammaliicoccus sciuri]